LFKWLITKFQKEYLEVTNDKADKNKDYKLIIQRGSDILFLIDVSEAIGAFIGKEVESIITEVDESKEPIVVKKG
jgi:hypothetical protein